MTADDLKPLATSIDYADLVARGVLKKAGRGRFSYLVLKPDELPKNASIQVSSIATTKAGLMATFKDTTKVARRLLAQIGRP